MKTPNLFDCLSIPYAFTAKYHALKIPCRNPIKKIFFFLFIRNVLITYDVESGDFYRNLHVKSLRSTLNSTCYHIA